MKIKNSKKLNLIAAAIIASSSMVTCQYAFADVSSATVKGVVETQNATISVGTEIKLVNVDSGFTKSALSNESGRYRLSGLKPGSYTIFVNGVQKPGIITVNVGDNKAMDIINTVKNQAESDNDNTDVEVITVTGIASVLDISSEVGTHVSQETINRMPQISRNFLAFADIAPGVEIEGVGEGNVSIRSGAQTSSSINVFIDGVSQKDYVLKGGVTGQDSSPGNPFPQAAIGQYKILTSNYKAELDEVASVGIIASTKSGGNEFEGGITLDYTNNDLRWATPQEFEDGAKAESHQKQYSLWASGPIIKDKLHFLATFEKKDQMNQTSANIYGKARDMLENHYLPEDLEKEIWNEIGVKQKPFEQELYFGKLDWQIDEDQDLSVSVKYRDEFSKGQFDGNQSYSRGSVTVNKDTRFTLKHNYYSNSFENELTLTYEDTEWNPEAFTVNAPGFNYDREEGGEAKDSIWRTGAGGGSQNKGQKGWAIQDDFTFADISLAGEHTIKLGFKYKKVNLTAIERHGLNPQVSLGFDVNNLDTSYLAENRLTASPYKLEYVQQLRTSSGELLNPEAISENSQLGVYIQDDWQITERLELNLGVRVSYEETPIYKDYKTPQDVLTALKGGVDANGEVVEPWANINYFAEGHNESVLELNPEVVVPNEVDFITPEEYTTALAEYQQAVINRSSHIASIADAIYDIDDYITDGSQRKSTKINFAPRLGFSYALNDDRTQVIYGGYGRSYDRTTFDKFQLETTKGAIPRRTVNIKYGEGSNFTCSEPCVNVANENELKSVVDSVIAGNGVVLEDGSTAIGGREVFMVNNNIKTPYVDQYSLGLRSQFSLYESPIETEIGIKEVKSRDGFMWKLGNRNPDGSFFKPGTTFGAPWSGDIQGNEHSHLLLGDNGLESDLTSWHIKIDKRYTTNQPWGFSLVYTHTDATENRQFSETFSLDYPSIDGFGERKSAGVSEHVVVSTVTYDLPWQIIFSGKLKLKSGAPAYGISSKFGPGNEVFDIYHHDSSSKKGMWAFTQFDMSLSKHFDVGSGTAFARIDVLNLFNTKNWNHGDGNFGHYDSQLEAFTPNENLGKHNNGLAGPMRLVKLSVGYNF